MPALPAGLGAGLPVAGQFDPQFLLSLLQGLGGPMLSPQQPQQPQLPPPQPVPFSPTPPPAYPQRPPRPWENDAAKTRALGFLGL